MREVKVEKEIEKWPLFMDRTCQQETSMNQTSTPAGDGRLIKDWNDPCTKANAAPNRIPQRPSTTRKPSPMLSITFIMTVIGHVFELKSREFCDFNHETNDCNNGFELECELECGVLSPGNKTIVAVSHTTAPAINFTPTGVGICETSVLGYDLINVLRPTSIQIPQGTKNENEIKNGSGRLWRHSGTATTSTALKNDGIHNYDSIDAESHEFSDLEYVFDAESHENDFNYDINQVFKYFANENFNGNGDCNAPCCPSPGMYIFNFFVFYFFILFTFFCLLFFDVVRVQRFDHQ